MPMLQQKITVQERTPWQEKRRTKMLDLGFDDGDMMIWVAPQQAILCDVCGDEAAIFQEEGNFCLDCWQERTEPYITVNRAREP
jgi:hypothetical protein